MKVYKEVDNPYSDANEIVEDCIIYTGNNLSIAHIPSGACASGGIIETVNLYNARGYQRWSDKTSSNMWQRSRTDEGSQSSSWSEWYKVGS